MLSGAFISGWVAFASGPPSTATLTTAGHGLFGVAVVALLPWKSRIITRAARMRSASLVLLIILITCLAAGFVELFVGYAIVAGVTPIQVHVGAAVVGVPFFLWHLIRHRRQRLQPADLSRRVLLRGAVLAAGIGGGYALLAGAARWTGPTRPRAATGSRPVDADAIPATIWLFDRVPTLDARHQVDVAGVPVSVSDLVARAETISARLDCTNGWYADATWGAVRLADLIPSDTLATAASLEVRSATGYVRSFPATEAHSLWLAVTCRGRLLTPGTGAPIRLVAPERRGFWWVKWVASVRVSGTPSWQQLPFPAQ
jgi:hypothetical protein